jgi:hypothetical protein
MLETMRSSRFLLGISALTWVFFVSAGVARAADKDKDKDDGDAKNPWVERPLTLKEFHAEFNAGIGVGSGPSANNGPQQLGAGSSFEGAVGLPFLGEIGVRSGYRFNNAGIAAGQGIGADYYGRLFDHETSNVGGDPFANPEIRLRGNLIRRPKTSTA